MQRCVLCLVERDQHDEQTWLTDAHIIPASVGGKLSVPFLCRRCNSTLGSEVEGPLVSDPGIRACIEGVADKLPASLLADLRQRQRWFAETDLGAIEIAGTAEGELLPLESQTFRREENARADMIADWRRNGLSESEIVENLRKFDEAAPGEILDLPGFTVRPRVDLAALEFGLPYDEPLVAEKLPLGIAFLYLCLFLGQTAYEADAVAPLRAALLANDTSAAEHWRVDHRIDRRGCVPEHRLAIKETAPVTVHVQLFQERVWWVTFPQVGVHAGPEAHYGIDIASGEEFRW